MPPDSRRRSNILAISVFCQKKEFATDRQAERLIGSIRRESLDHLVVFDEAQLRRVLKNYASYYDEVRPHLSLDKNASDFRRPQKLGLIAAISILGGLHHQYVRV
jgi:hypothetical protein